MVICVPVTAGGAVDPRWGRADRVAIAETAGGEIASWRELDVGWGTLHDEGTEGSHHARIARFLRDHDVQTVVADHMGPPMAHMLQQMGLTVLFGAAGDARAAVIAAIEA